MHDPADNRRQLRVVFLNWRDSRNPEGGGAERYVEHVARALSDAGHHVTILCARHQRAGGEEVRDGVRYLHRGGKLTVYPAALLHVALRRLGRVDVVVDVQNGIPFFSRLVTRIPVVVLVHHVHREQWPIVYGRTAASLGWFLESRVAPMLYRSCQYVAVSESTRHELETLGVDPKRIAVVHNGTTRPIAAAPPSTDPEIIVLGRLVPHKRVEHAIDVLARLRPRYRGLRLTVVGDGWWRNQLQVHARRRGVAEHVNFAGFVDERTKDELLARAWVHLLPSVKEGWGLAVMEAAGQGVPTVAYRSAGGVGDSIVDGVTGLLVSDGVPSLSEGVGALLDNAGLRRSLGDKAQLRAETFTWERTADAFATVLQLALLHRGKCPTANPKRQSQV